MGFLCLYIYKRPGILRVCVGSPLCECVDTSVWLGYYNTEGLCQGHLDVCLFPQIYIQERHNLCIQFTVKN